MNFHDVSAIGTPNSGPRLGWFTSYYYLTSSKKIDSENQCESKDCFSQTPNKCPPDRRRNSVVHEGYSCTSSRNNLHIERPRS